MTPLLIGADVGATSTRVAVADLHGTVLAVAHESGGNPNAVGVDTSALRIRTAMQRALARAGEDAGSPGSSQSQGSGRAPDVAAIVLGMAGYNTAIAAGPDFLRACLPDGIAPVPRIVSDLGVGYASGSPLPHGYVVVAGTGSGAAEIDRGGIVGRRGAWGWLLGDEGGGFWLGREAVRQALAEVQRGVGRSDLSRQVIDRLGIDPDRALEGLLRVPYERSPIALAELAPLVTGLLDSDPAAVSIAARSAEILAELVLDLDPRPGLPVVMTGSILESAGPIRTAFSERMTAATGNPVVLATSGLVGALWLATGDVFQVPDPAAHERLTTTLSGFRSPINGSTEG